MLWAIRSPVGILALAFVRRSVGPATCRVFSKADGVIAHPRRVGLGDGILLTIVRLLFFEA